MPIEPALNFQNEADFTSRFLVPLLRRLGYSIVAEYHGQQEFGKDLVFGEIDRFGEAAYHGLQAKYVDSIGQKESEGLIDDCRQAFRHSFRHPNTGTEQRINTFVIANAGNIADNARTNFFTAATNEEHGGNVRMFDGKALLALDRWATISRVEQVGEVLTGILFELRVNRTRIAKIRPLVQECLKTTSTSPPAPSPLPADRLRIAAISQYLQKPMMPTFIDIAVVSNYYDLCDTGVNNMLDGAVVCSAASGMIDMLNEILRNFGLTETVGLLLENMVTSALTKLQPLTPL